MRKCIRVGVCNSNKKKGKKHYHFYLISVFALLKFRFGEHRLSIEVGEQHNLPGEDRNCMKCNVSVLVDEFYF